jgi:uncharacterized integral membrane protein
MEVTDDGSDTVVTVIIVAILVLVIVPITLVIYIKRERSVDFSYLNANKNCGIILLFHSFIQLVSPTIPHLHPLGTLNLYFFKM